jgi:tetratricopeptide (TPR) repeat protein
LKKGLKIKPLVTKQYEDIYYQLGQTFEEAGQLKDALEAFNKVLELKGGKASAELESKIKELKEQVRGS